MTTGALIFAHDNENIDYLAMAAWSADNIRRHLGIPVAVVTDIQRDILKKFDKVISAPKRTDSSFRNFSDTGLITWHNTNRMDAYSLTPWDQTLLLDADYVVASDDLKKILDTDQDLLAHRSAYDVTSQNDFSGLNYFGSHRMPMWWATVIMFRKSQHARFVFESMSMIRDHWKHYVNIYKTGNSVYRNDHSLTIALGIVNGHTLDYPSIPWSLASILPEHALSQIAQDHYRLDFTDGENRRRCIEIKNQDFHAMGKKYLGDIVAKNLA